MSCMGSLSVWPTSSFPRFFRAAVKSQTCLSTKHVYKHSFDACKTENQDNFEKKTSLIRHAKADRWRAVGMIEAGVRHTDVAKQFGVHRNTEDALWRRYQQFGTTRDRPRSGRLCVKSNHQDTYIWVVHLRDRLRTATLTARSIPGLRWISPRTVRNRLRERGIRPRRPAIRPVLQQCHRVARFVGVDDIYASRNRTGHVFFSRMNRSRVYRRVSERFHDSCVIQRRPFGRGSDMVWGGISSRGRTALGRHTYRHQIP